MLVPRPYIRLIDPRAFDHQDHPGMERARALHYEVASTIRIALRWDELLALGGDVRFGKGIGRVVNHA